MIYTILHLNIIVESSKSGLTLWLHQLVPTLLPFSIISYLITQTNIFGKYYFIFSIFLGYIFGMPIGCKLAMDGYKEKILSIPQSQALLNYCNQLSPSFVVYYVIHEVIQNDNWNIIGILLIYITPFVMLCIHLRWNKIPLLTNSETKNMRINIATFNEAILHSSTVLIRLCGYTVAFSIINGIIYNLFSMSLINSAIIFSVLEISNGVLYWGKVTQIYNSLCIFIFPFIAFGGLSCIIQTLSLITPGTLSKKSYLKTKMLLTLLCGLQAAIIFILLDQQK